jgi:hypothetical protein
MKHYAKTLMSVVSIITLFLVCPHQAQARTDFVKLKACSADCLSTYNSNVWFCMAPFGYSWCVASVESAYSACIDTCNAWYLPHGSITGAE